MKEELEIDLIYFYSDYSKLIIDELNPSFFSLNI